MDPFDLILLIWHPVALLASCAIAADCFKQGKASAGGLLVGCAIITLLLLIHIMFK